MRNELWTLKNKKTVVTGSTRGIGRAVAEELLNLGLDVMIVSRNQADFENEIGR